MTFVLTGSCIRCIYTDCVDVCLAPQWKTTTRIAALPDADEWTTVDAKRTELKR
jgi:hypothetical protein